MTFIECTLADGRKLDLPPYAVQFLEGLDDKARAEHPGCKSGFFYDVGGLQPTANGQFQHGTLQSALVQEPYAKLAKAVRAGHPGVARVELETPTGLRVMLECERIVSLQDREGGGAVITHRVGDRMLPLNVAQSRDEIRAAMAEQNPPPPGLEIVEPERIAEHG